MVCNLPPTLDTPHAACISHDTPFSATKVTSDKLPSCIPTLYNRTFSSTKSLLKHRQKHRWMTTASILIYLLWTKYISKTLSPLNLTIDHSIIGWYYCNDYQKCDIQFLWGGSKVWGLFLLKIVGILKVGLIQALKRPIDLRALAPWWEQKVRKRWGGHSNLGITSHVWYAVILASHYTPLHYFVFDKQ